MIGAKWRRLAPNGDDWRQMAPLSEVIIWRHLAPSGEFGTIKQRFAPNGAKWRHVARNGDCCDLKSIEINKRYCQFIDNYRQMPPNGAIWCYMAKFGHVWRHLARNGDKWHQMAKFGVIWRDMARYGAIWLLEHLWPNGAERRHLAMKILRMVFFRLCLIATWRYRQVSPTFGEWRGLAIAKWRHVAPRGATWRQITVGQNSIFSGNRKKFDFAKKFHGDGKLFKH